MSILTQSAHLATAAVVCTAKTRLGFYCFGINAIVADSFDPALY
jgi:hypothetical protein